MNPSPERGGWRREAAPGGVDRAPASEVCAFGPHPYPPPQAGEGFAEVGALNPSPQATRDSKIRREAFDFPVAVAHRVRPVAAAQLLGPRGDLAVDLGAALRRFGERALGRRRQLSPVTILAHSC